MIKVGIVGGANPNAGELLRLLINHPDVAVRWVHSAENVGRKVSDIHRGLIGEFDAEFTDAMPFTDIDLLFICLPAGEGRRFIERNDLPADLRIIDLSGDLRLGNSDNDFVYGLPEINRKQLVRGATRASVPGALATAVNLALLPLARHLMLTRNIHVTAITGRSGDDCGEVITPEGRLPHFVDSLKHKQEEEIRETLRSQQTSFASDIDIVSIIGNHRRGLAAMVYFDSPVPASTVKPLFDEFYSDHNFTFTTDSKPTIEDVSGTNKCLLHVENIGSKLVVTAVIDNILKGGAGQAVHIMNLLFGLHERVGLQLKSDSGI